jgi:hypothetical protein
LALESLKLLQSRGNWSGFREAAAGDREEDSLIAELFVSLAQIVFAVLDWVWNHRNRSRIAETGVDLVKAAAAAGDCEARNRQKRGEEEAGEWRRRTWETQVCACALFSFSFSLSGVWSVLRFISIILWILICWKIRISAFLGNCRHKFLVDLIAA